MELNLDFLRNLRIIIGFKFKFAEREVFLLPDWESLVKLLKRDKDSIYSNSFSIKSFFPLFLPPLSQFYDIVAANNRYITSICIFFLDAI